MATKAKFQAIKGTRDLLPPETQLWNRVEQTAHEVFSTFGFGEIRMPIFEETDLFARSIGLDTDVVSKEMYTFEDRPDEIEQNQRLHEAITEILTPPRYEIQEAHIELFRKVAERWKESDQVTL